MAGLMVEAQPSPMEMTSDSGALRVRYDVRQGLSMELGPQGLGGHTVESLADEAEALLADIWARLRARVHVFDRDPADAEIQARLAAIPDGLKLWREHHRLIIDATQDLHVEAKSPDGSVSIIVYPDGDVAVAMTPGCLGGDRETLRTLENLTRTFHLAAARLGRRLLELGREVNAEITRRKEHVGD